MTSASGTSGNRQSNSGIPTSDSVREVEGAQSLNAGIRSSVSLSIRSLRVQPSGAIVGGLVAALVLIALTSINLTSQGLFYDEVLHARDAFFYRGTSPTGALQYNGIPVLTRTYNGAIREHIYGPYLKFEPFTVRSWRLAAILVSAAGLLGFFVICRRTAPGILLASFALLLLTDSSVILSTRHDWGSTAFALGLRLMFVGIWIARELDSRSPYLKASLLGLVIGIAIFDKLSAVVLLLPLVIMLWSSIHPVRTGTCVAVMAGLLLGTSPLIAANLWSYLTAGSLISLGNVNAQASKVAVADFLLRYPALGQGSELQDWILGQPSSIWLYRSEFLLLSGLIVAIGVAAWRLRNESQLSRMAGVMILSYVVVGMALPLLPQVTWVHHWIQGTPFQDAAIACAVTACLESRHRGKQNRTLNIVAFAAVALILVRLPAVASVERAFADGRAGIDFDPSYSRLGEFAASSRDSIFIAADWGIGMQIYCLTDGSPEIVYEMFDMPDARQLTRNLIQATDHDTLYLLTRRRHSPVFPAATSDIEDEIGSSPLWREVTPEGPIRNLRAVYVRKFERAATPRSNSNN